MHSLVEFEYSPIWDIYPTEVCQMFLDQLEALLVLGQEFPTIFSTISLYLFPENVERSRLVVHGEKITVNAHDHKSLDEIRQVWQRNREQKQRTPVIVHLVLKPPFLFQQPIIHDFTSSEPVIVDSGIVTKQKKPEENTELAKINPIIATLVAIAICSLKIDDQTDFADCQLSNSCPVKNH